MKLANLLIVSSAFTIAVVSSFVTHRQHDKAILNLFGRTSVSECIPIEETLEPSCSLLATGQQCTALLETEEDSEIIPVFVTPLSLPLCMIPIRWQN
jgi:hypothetical protein